MQTQRIDYHRPWVYPKQERAIFNPIRYSVIEATTKAGKTAGCIMWLFEKALLGREGANHWWIAPVYPQSEIAYRRMKASLDSSLLSCNGGKMTLTLKTNGAVIWFKSGDNPDNLYGEDVWSGVIDEASRVKEEAWHAIRSTLTATKGPLRIIGNVKGRRNWFYQMARKAQGGSAGMEYHKITCLDAIEAGIIDPEEVEDARRMLPEQVFKELYLAEPSDDGGNPFGLSHIANCATLSALSESDPVVWGWDLAKSVDWTVGIGLDEEKRVCRFERFQMPWKKTKERIIEVTNGVPALVDSTGVGDPVLEDLQDHGHFEGFKFTSQSKQQLMEGLTVSIQQQLLAYPFIDDTYCSHNSPNHIKMELDCFEYEYTRTGVRYTAPEGEHDDCVCALALADKAYNDNMGFNFDLALASAGNKLSSLKMNY